MTIPAPYPYPYPFLSYPPHTHFFSNFNTHTREKWGGFGAGFSGSGETPIPTENGSRGFCFVEGSFIFIKVGIIFLNFFIFKIF